MKIKICGMKYPENILEVASLYPDYLGFIFYPASKRYVLGQHQTIFENFIENRDLRAQKVGVFVNEEIKNVIHYATQYDMNLIQLHGDETPEYCEQLRYLGFQLIKAFGINEQFEFSVLDEYEDVCDYFLFDTKSPAYGGTGKKFDWTLLKKYTQLKPIFLSGGLESDDIPSIHNLLNDLPIHALDFNSKLENDKMEKDIIKCKNTIEIIRSNFK